MNNTKISWTQKTWNPIPNFDGYFVQVLKEGFLFSKWIDVKGFATKKQAQEFKKMLES